MGNSNYNIEKKDKFTLIKINVDRFTARITPDLKHEMSLLKDNSVKSIIFDLEDVRYCDSSGLSVILIANRLCEENNGSLVLCGASPNVQKLIEISQLSNVLTMVPTFNEAVDYLYMDELEKGLGDMDVNAN